MSGDKYYCVINLYDMDEVFERLQILKKEFGQDFTERIQSKITGFSNGTEKDKRRRATQDWFFDMDYLSIDVKKRIKELFTEDLSASD